MHKVIIEEEDYYTGKKLNIINKKTGFFVKSFMKLGLGKTEDEAGLWVILISVLLFGTAFFTFLG